MQRYVPFAVDSCATVFPDSIRTAQPCANGVGHADMGNNAVSEKGAAPVLRMVIELVGDDDISGLDVFLHAADRADRNDPLDTELLHSVNIGAVVDIGRENPVPAAVAGKKRHPFSVQGADDILVRGFTEGRRNVDRLHLGQPFHLIQTAAADNADPDFFCSGSPLYPFKSGPG